MKARWLHLNLCPRLQTIPPAVPNEVAIPLALPVLEGGLCVECAQRRSRNEKQIQGGIQMIEPLAWCPAKRRTMFGLALIEIHMNPLLMAWTVAYNLEF
jgi:hypothetical protein